MPALNALSIHSAEATEASASVGERMYQWAETLYPICRSLTGPGVRETLRFLQQQLPGLELKSIPSGTEVFDWTVPDEWTIRDAYVADLETGERVIDFQAHNLHVVGYSEPVDTILSFKELEPYLYSRPEQPDVIPYVTSYYKRRWGFCLTQQQREQLARFPEKRYRVCIDSTLSPGHLHYGELLIPGQTEEAILLSTYVCHPSMANNELSGPVVTAALAQWLQKELPNRRYTYRILFLVETIGAIAYLSQHLETMKKHTRAGFVLTCVGDERAYSYVASRLGNTLADKVAQHVLREKAPAYKSYSYLQRGSDERQYCSPGIDLPVCSICRSKYGEYPEYHTSADDLSLISPTGLQGAYEVYQDCIRLLEGNKTYQLTTLCEPQLGKRGLYPTLSTKDSARQARTLINLLAYADGQHDVLALAEHIGEYAPDLLPLITQLEEAGLLRLVEQRD